MPILIALFLFLAQPTIAQAQTENDIIATVILEKLRQEGDGDFAETLLSLLVDYATQNPIQEASVKKDIESLYQICYGKSAKSESDKFYNWIHHMREGKGYNP